MIILADLNHESNDMTKETQPNSFVIVISSQQGAEIREYLIAQDFILTKPPFTVFSAKGKNLNCTFYESGKLVVQGKDCGHFVEFYLEPKILHTFIYTNPLSEVASHPRIGIDESGKGDFFGPLCIAGVYVDGNLVAKLKEIGVKDSKKMSDSAIKKAAVKIKSLCPYHVVKINPAKYNEIYSGFRNLNALLAWGHATTIEKLVEKTGCKEVIIDQFANESVVIHALNKKKIELQLTQRHKGEEDLAVAAASILAREAFIDGLEKLGKEMGLVLPKGAGEETLRVGKKIFDQYGLEFLKNLCKEHFKTLDAILAKGRE